MIIVKSMRIIDIIETYPETEDIFRQYDAKCKAVIMFQYLYETVEQVAKRYELNLDEMLVRLNKVIGGL